MCKQEYKTEIDTADGQVKRINLFLLKSLKKNNEIFKAV